jgi:hypothetical protein
MMGEMFTGKMVRTNALIVTFFCIMASLLCLCSLLPTLLRPFFSVVLINVFS